MSPYKDFLVPTPGSGDREVRLLLDDAGRLKERPKDGKGAEIAFSANSYAPATENLVGYKLVLVPPTPPDVPDIDPGGGCQIINGQLRC